LIPHTMPSAKPTRILIAEDEAVTAMSLAMDLTDMGYCVVATAITAKQAIEAAIEHRPDILLMDISLRGEIDGIAAAIEIQRITGSPVVFLTGHSDEMTKSKAASVGASAYLLKPYLQSELKAAMESILQKNHASPS